MAKGHWFDFPCGDILKELKARGASADAINHAVKAFEVEVNNPASSQLYYARGELYSALVGDGDLKNAAIVKDLLDNHMEEMNRFDVERESYGGAT